jgi:hypothetical protein
MNKVLIGIVWCVSLSVSLFIIIFIRNEAGSTVGSGGFHQAHPGSNPSVVLHKKTPHLFLPNHRSN